MNDVQVYASPIPFSNKQVAMMFPHGISVQEMVDSIMPPEFTNDEIAAVVLIRGNIITKDQWDMIPDHGTMNIRIVPGKGGGGGKNPIVTLLSIAVLIAAPYIGGYVATMAAGGMGPLTAGQMLLGKVVTAAVGVVGRLAVSALAPPPTPSNVGYAGNTSSQNAAESPTQFIEGAKNSISPFGVVPVCLGTNRMFPLQAARPYTESQDGEQYVRQLFTYGFGDTVSISDMKIGETDITDFTDYELEHKLSGDLHDGTTLYTNDVYQDDFSILLDYATGYVTRTSQVGADELIVDLTLPQGLCRYDSNGARQSQSVEYQVEYALSDESPQSWTTAETTSLAAAQKEAMRKSTRISLPTNDQYDVRVKRNSADATSDQVFDTIYFSSLKTVTHQSPVSLEGINGTACRIKATDQLNGALAQFNVVCSNHIPDYDLDTHTWIERATSNPASIYRYVLQGAPNARALADSKINIEDLESWHTHCETEGYTYNRVIDYDASVEELLRDVAAAGAASPAIVDGQRTIAIDKIKDDIVQVVTPRNSWNYSGEMVFPEIPHAFRVQFRNANKGYQQDERIVYDDGYSAANATIFEVLELQSCTDPDLAFKIARRHLAAIRLRPETHTWNMDVEHLVALRGDRIILEHDAPIIGVGDGRIKEVTTDSGSPELVTGFTIDDTVTIPNASTYYVRVRLADGTLIYKELVTSIGEMTQFDFAVPFTVDDTPAAGDLCAFFEAGGELDLIITMIEPEGDLSAKITAINYAQPHVNQAEHAAIPAFDSKVTTPLEFVRPIAPVLMESQSNESVMLLNSDGSWLTRAIFTLDNLNESDVTPTVKIRAAGASVFHEANVMEAQPGRVIITGLEDGKYYDVHIRYKRPNSNMLSKPLEMNNYLFVGASGLPADVDNFKVTITEETAFFKWDQNADIDLSHYIIKYANIFTGATWETALTLENYVAHNRISIPFSPGTYMVKAVDKSGNESESETTIITYDPGTVRNAVEVVDDFNDSPALSGTTDNVTTTATEIFLTDPDNIGYYYMAETIDMGAIYPAFVSAALSAGGVSLDSPPGNNNVFDMDDIFTEEDLFGIGTGAWSVEVQYAMTDDDPASSPVTWTDWAALEAGTQEFRGMKFRLKLTSYAQNISPIVLGCPITVDMPDRIERGEDLTCSAASGDTVTFTPNFMATPAIAITIQDGETDDKIEFTSKTASGFTFKVYNDTSSAYVERSYDYIASGYGRKNT